MKVIRMAYLIAEALDVDVILNDARRKLFSVVGSLGLPQEYYHRVLELSKTIDHVLPNGRAPESKYAAVLWAIANTEGRRITQAEVANAWGVSEQTLRETWIETVRRAVEIM